ncbi:hypothetical protein IMZ31_23835 (plasmid) [Pontibacillus sp. ALD_SL1]|uniref:hypothetical protein n=1 Tax=Pontibacillus sp. ALD_SL1 TaxID=2777185 RepID=UPI001A961A1D|nr:hypothetical protein [Pontibacillus sp. ALD_SL1]QST02484.1 hypothetical protein IMZ31_23835 [Pontibacillus sp. ALD_SL1]
MHKSENQIKTLKEISERIKSGKAAEQDKQNGQNLLQRLNDVSKELRCNEKWERYYTLIHDIENSDFKTVKEGARIGKELKKAVQETPHHHTIQEILIVTDTFAFLLRESSEYRERLQHLKEKSFHDIPHDHYNTYRNRMRELTLEMERVVMTMRSENQAIIQEANERLIDIHKELHEIENTLMEVQDLITYYYGMLRYRELRKERRELKSVLHQLRKIKNFRSKISPEFVYNELQKFNMYVEFSARNSEKNKKLLLQTIENQKRSG